MWKFMFLVMMVFTRTRAEDNSGGPANQSVATGSASDTAQPSTRRRRRNTPTTTNANQHVAPLIVHQQADVNQPQVNPLKRRGPSLNLDAAKALDNLPKGSKIDLTMATGMKGFVGTTATQFATECGIVIRNICPMNFHRWESIPANIKDLIYEKLQGKFNLLRSNRVFMEYVDDRLHRQWKRTRGDLSAHWKKNGGKTNPRLARLSMKSNCRSQEDWDHLCDYWELEATRKYNDKMEINRGKQVISSRGGSRSIANHKYHMTNLESQTPPSPFELYYKLHYNDKKGWQNDEARIEYENIKNHKKEAVAKLISEGTTITTTMHQELENEAIQSVCAKEKTTKSAWKVGSGPVFRKKDFRMISEAGSSQSPSSETEALQNQVASLEEELKQSNEKYDKLSMFMCSKFSDFESSMSAPANSGANDSDELEGNVSLI